MKFSLFYFFSFGGILVAFHFLRFWLSAFVYILVFVLGPSSWSYKLPDMLLSLPFSIPLYYLY